MLELGLDTFGDRSLGADGALVSHAQALREVVEQAVRADELGLAFFGVGEHHRKDFAVSAPEVVLAAIAARTSKIHLGSAVTVLSSDDPVRVFQRFSTLDALSNGRAEVILGRGSFTESFPLFGFDLKQYEPLFEQKLARFAEVRTKQERLKVFPPIADGKLLTTWVGVGGSPESVVRCARYGFGLMLAIIGGEPSRFVPYVELFKRALGELKQTQAAEPGSAAPVGVHCPGHVAETDQQARDELWPHYQKLVSTIGAERGWPPPARAQFDRECAVGAQFCGSPETVAQKIADTVKTLQLQRFDLKYATGPMPHAMLLRGIELYAKEVVPRVRKLLGEQ